MRTWDYFFPDVLPEVLGCPEPTAERHILRAARRFCDETSCWREDLDRITTREGKTTYDISLPDSAEGVKLVAAALDAQDIALETEEGTSLADRRAGNSGRRRVYSPDGLETVIVMPTPGEGQVLLLRASLKPAEDALGISADRIAKQYRTAIAGGALATLLMANKAPWANPGLAAVKEQEFRDAIASTKEAVRKAHTNARLRTVTTFY